MSVNSKKLHGVTFYLHHIDMQLYKYKTDPKAPDLHASFIHWPEFIYVIYVIQVSHCQSPQQLGLIPKTWGRTHKASCITKNYI